MTDTLYQITKFGVNIADFTNIAIRIITPNRGKVYVSGVGIMTSAEADTAGKGWDDTVIDGVYNDLLGVTIFTIPSDLEAGNDYDILFYNYEGSFLVQGSSPYDGRKMVWTGSSIASLTDYVGNDVTFKPSPMGGGFGF